MNTAEPPICDSAPPHIPESRDAERHEAFNTIAQHPDLIAAIRAALPHLTH